MNSSSIIKDIRTNLSDIERQWYLKAPVDRQLTDEIVDYFSAAKADAETKKKNPPEVIEIQDGYSLKYFVRSFRYAFRRLVKSNAKSLKSKEDLKSKLDAIFKTTIKFKIGDLVIPIAMDPHEAHLGNGRTNNVGTYEDLKKIFSYMTSRNTEKAKALASLLLDFAKKPVHFKHKDLKKVNNELFSDDIDKQKIKEDCESLTRIAFHHMFFESSRRLILKKINGEYTARMRADFPIASHIISTLKLIRDGVIKDIDQAFDPKSQLMIITRKNANNTSDKNINNISNTHAALFAGRLIHKSKGKTKKINSDFFVKHNLEPNSEDESETSDYDEFELNIKDPKKIKKYITNSASIEETALTKEFNKTLSKI